MDFVIPVFAARQYLPNPNADIEPPQFVATKRRPFGMVEKGNINLRDRPRVWNPEGGYSSVYSMSFQFGDDHIVVPLVTDAGKIESPDEAIDRFALTGRHLGKFSTARAAEAYADLLHKQQEEMFGGK